MTAREYGAGGDRAGRRGAARHPAPPLDRRQVVVALARGPQERRKKEDTAETLTVAGREVRVTQPGQALLHARGEAQQAGRRPLLPLGRRRRAGRNPRSPHRPQALRRRRGGRGLLSEARARQAPRLAAHGDAVVSLGADGRGGRGRRRGRPGLHREPRLPRAAPARGAGRRSRPPRRAARRSRSRAGRRLGRRAPRGAGGQGAARRAGPHAGGPRPAAHAGCTSTRASTRAGASATCAARRWRCRARSSGARRRSPPRSGGRRSATASSSTTTRTPRTGPPARPIQSARCPTRGSRRRSTGARSPTATRPTSPWPRCRRASPRAPIPTPAWTPRPGASTDCWSWRRATTPRGSATPPGRPTSARPRARRRGWRRRARAAPPRRAAAGDAAGSRPTTASPRPGGAPRRCRSSQSRTRPTSRRRWQGSNAGRRRHAEAAAQLAVDDVLIDAMRGRSSTWTRIRINLRHVPEATRPPQETPDPDDDPTREWRRRWAEARARGEDDPGA